MKAAGWALGAALASAACAQPGPTPLTPAPAPGPGPLALHAADAHTRQRLQTSLATWQALRTQVSDYRYQVVFESHTGFRSLTRVQVRGHRVVERSLLTQAGRGSGLSLQWLETGGELGTHPGAAPALTLDQLYARAQDLLQRPLRPHEQLSLGMDARGLLAHCFIRDTRLTDDAPSEGVPPLQLELN